MRQMRLRTILLACWIVLIYSIERITDFISISDTAYMLVLIVILLILFFPHMPRIPLWVVLIIALSLFFLVRIWTGDLAKSISLWFVMAEMGAVFITCMLAYWLAIAMNEFEKTVSQILIGRRDKIPEADSVGQGFLYREVRRARNHQRPLALIAIGVNEKSLNLTQERMVQEIQQAMVKQYRLSGLSKTLCDELEDCAVIVQRDDHFLVALPETKPEDVPIIIDRLRRRVTERVGVEIEIGAALMPNDSFTYEGLIDKATIEMRSSLGSGTLADFDRIHSNGKATVLK